MSTYSNAEKADMVLALGVAQGDSRGAARIVSLWHPGRRPSPSTILRAYEQLRQRGSFIRPSRSLPSRSLSVDEITDVLAYISAHPHASVREISAASGLSKSTVSNVLRRNGLHPYHVHLHHALVDRDFQNRLDFCNWVLNCVAEDRHITEKILWTDEAKFGRSAQVNIHNAHYWSTRNPHWVLRAMHQYQWSFNVWCGILDGSVIGPLFFDNTLNSDRYVKDILQGPVDRLQTEMPLSRCAELWFQHDGAPPHASRQTQEWLNRRFPMQWIGRGGAVSWPARSPDLTPLDFFFVGLCERPGVRNRNNDAGRIKEKDR